MVASAGVFVKMSMQHEQDSFCGSLYYKRMMGIPVWRLHLHCLLMNIDPSIIPSGGERGVKQSSELP